MSLLKSWVLNRVHWMNGLVARTDLPPRDTMPAPPATEPFMQRPEPVLSNADYLGSYGPLIAAVREELEHFVVGHVRLHIAIADRDRFLLTSIGVRCPDDGHARELLAQFTHEFKPEQVKRYLAREVIAALPNASAIDLSQFAGLFDADGAEDPNEYRELLVALRAGNSSPNRRPYQVSIVGRWSEIDAVNTSAATAEHVMGGVSLATPLAGLRCEFDVEDGNGKRRVVLQSVIAGRRYMIGKDEGCDIRVHGTYASRRHGEIWLDKGAWWVTDAGSTNGIRVESAQGVIGRCGATAGKGANGQPIELVDGALVVLSAHAEGSASDYPSLRLRPAASMPSRVTPLAGAAPSSSTTPLTPIRQARTPDKLTLTARLATGERTLELHAFALPVAVGRSRNQQFVIDRIHEAVSGHHLDIVGVDEAGALVQVHGDNGVLVEGVVYPAGARFHWKVGDTMVLGPAQGETECSLMLSRSARSDMSR